MVSKPAVPVRLPSAPMGAFALVEASIALWRASLRRTFAAGLLCGIATVLPSLGLGDLPMQLAQLGLATVGKQQSPFLDLLPLDDLRSAALPLIGAWLTQPTTIALFAIALLVAMLASARIVQHQIVACGADDAVGSARLLASFASFLVYLLLMVVATLPMLALWAVLYVAAAQAEPVIALLYLMLFVVGSLLSSVPLVWASIAFGLAPYLSVTDRLGPLRALSASRRLVRGHWRRAAIVTSVPMLFYLGASSVISSIIMTVVAGAVVAVDGWGGLLSHDWPLWTQLLGLLPTALVLPMAFAGGVLCRNDLILRHRGAADSST